MCYYGYNLWHFSDEMRPPNLSVIFHSKYYPLLFSGAGYPGAAAIGGAFAPGFSPVGGFAGYRPPLGFSTVPGTTGTGL